MNSFRIFDKKNNTYLDLKKKHYVIDNNGAVFIIRNWDIFWMWRDFEIELWSWLFDKNGLEIFHNDILERWMYTFWPVLVQYDVWMTGFELLHWIDDEWIGFTSMEHLIDTSWENDLWYNMWEVIWNKNEHPKIYEQVKNPLI